MRWKAERRPRGLATAQIVSRLGRFHRHFQLHFLPRSLEKSRCFAISIKLSNCLKGNKSLDCPATERIKRMQCQPQRMRKRLRTYSHDYADRMVDKDIFLAATEWFLRHNNLGRWNKCCLKKWLITYVYNYNKYLFSSVIIFEDVNRRNFASSPVHHETWYHCKFQ